MLETMKAVYEKIQEDEKEFGVTLEAMKTLTPSEVKLDQDFDPLSREKSYVFVQLQEMDA